MHSNAAVFLGKFAGNFQSPIRAAIIDDYAFKIPVRLIQYAFNAFLEIGLAVVDWGYDAYERFLIHI